MLPVHTSFAAEPRQVCHAGEDCKGGGDAEQGVERQQVAHELDLLRSKPQERNEQGGNEEDLNCVALAGGSPRYERRACQSRYTPSGMPSPQITRLRMW